MLALLMNKKKTIFSVLLVSELFSSWQSFATAPSRRVFFYILSPDDAVSVSCCFWCNLPRFFSYFFEFYRPTGLFGSIVRIFCCVSATHLVFGMCFCARTNSFWLLSPFLLFLLVAAIINEAIFTSYL